MMKRLLRALDRLLMRVWPSYKAERFYAACRAEYVRGDTRHNRETQERLLREFGYK